MAADTPKPSQVHPGAPDYPRALLGGSEPSTLFAIGNTKNLRQPLTALFCSNRCPGSAILRALDLATKLRDENRAVISGFHTPVEKECLAVLLRGKSPIVICPARSLDRYRIPAGWKSPLAEGRLLLLSPFPAGTHRATAETAQRRNEFVATLATETTVLYAAPGGRLEKLATKFQRLGRPAATKNPK
jgi:predicted Rossmann fold nucleotide-binding protein DprA/Smf involved in DNA uptake